MSRPRRPRKKRFSRRRDAGRASWKLVLLVLLFLVGCCSIVHRRARTTSVGPSPRQKGGERQPTDGAKKSPYCLVSCPVAEPGRRNTILEREGYLLSNNPETKLADWAAYRITRGTIGRSKRRDWEADPDLPADETLEPEDYSGAHATLGTDRGHQVPLASFSGTRRFEPLNYMSNLTPQRSELNQRLWNLLEQEERKLVLSKQAEALFVVTGPLFEKDMASLPRADEPHRVPSGYFKVIALEEGAHISTAAIIVSQDTPGTDSHCAHRVTVDEVERRSKLDLFADLPDAEEAELERAEGTLFPRLGCR